VPPWPGRRGCGIGSLVCAPAAVAAANMPPAAVAANNVRRVTSSITLTPFRIDVSQISQIREDKIFCCDALCVSRSVDLNLLSSQRSIAIILRKQRIAQAPYFQSLR